MNEKHLKHYLKICKNYDMSTIENMMVDIKNRNNNDHNTINNICNKYMINNDEFDGLNHIMQMGGDLNNDNLYQDVYIKYHTLKGGNKWNSIKSIAGKVGNLVGKAEKAVESVSPESAKKFADLKDEHKASFGKLASIVKQKVSAAKKMSVGNAANLALSAAKGVAAQHVGNLVADSGIGNMVSAQIDKHIDQIFEKMKHKIVELIKEELKKHDSHHK